MNTKEANQQLRAELKAAFPGVKFSVRNTSGAVRVKWIDGPTTKEVEAIANKYQNISYCEYTHEILSGGNSYVFCNRAVSEAVLKSAIDAVAAQWMRTRTAGEVWMTQEQRDQIEIAPEWNDVGFRISKSHTFYDWTRRDFSDAVYEHLKDISYFVAPAPGAKATKAEPERVQSTVIATETQAEPAPTEVEAEVHIEMLAIAPAKATPAFLPQAIAQTSAYSGYTVVQEAVTYAPVVVSGRSPQQELKDKLSALNVDALDAEQISLLLKAIG